MPLSRARETEERRENLVQSAVARIVGEKEAEYLMDRLGETPHPLERNRPSASVYGKVERLSLTAKGRARLASAKTWSDVEKV